jgi:hypothetical protein
MKIMILNFRNYKYMCLVSLVVGLVIVILFFEYFFIEENLVYAMKKFKLLSDDLFTKSQYKYNYGKKFNYHSFYSIDLEKTFYKNNNNSVTFLSNSSTYITPFSNMDILDFKSSFSTFRNNRVSSAISIVVDLKFNMTLNYLKNHIYYIDSKSVKEYIWPFLKNNLVYSNICESFSIGFENHGWLLIYDEVTNKYLIGICTHDNVFNICTEFGCGLESSTVLISDIDFSGLKRDQYLRRFILFEDMEINNILRDILNNNTLFVSFKNRSNMDMPVILEMINSNNFNYINKSGQFFMIAKNEGQLLKCCLDFKSLLNNYNVK